MKAELRPGERLDDLQINDYYIIQNPDKFCFGMDAVLLSSFAHCAPGSKVADFGTGTGIIPILLTAKTERPRILMHSKSKPKVQTWRDAVSNITD